MPSYKVNDTTYTIPEDKVDLFEADYPDALLQYNTKDGKSYAIPASKRKDFLTDFPDATSVDWDTAPSAEQSTVRDFPVFDDEPNGTPQKARGFKAGARESWKGLKAGFQNLWGEAANMVTGSSQDAADAVYELDNMLAEGRDVVEETADAWSDAGREIRTGALEFLPGWMIKGWKERVLDKAEKQKVLSDIRDVLGEAGGDVDKARELLVQRAQDQTYGDKQIASARDKFAGIQETEGLGAWIGSNAVQMIPSASALIVGALTKSPGAAKAIGMIGMGGMTAATAGSSMYEARQAGADDLKTWKTGVVDGMIEYITEKLPFDRYTSRILGKVKGEVAEDLFSSLRNNNATRNELERLLKNANERLGGKLFSKKNLAEYVGDMLAEGASEFSAEALQTMTAMMYEEPENYPTLSEILKNGWEGAKAGFFMGAVLGGASKTMEHNQHRKRRMEKGSVDIAQVDFGNGEKDVVEVVDYDDKTNTATVLHDGSFERVSGDAISDGYRFSYDEFENARLRELEDEAIVNGNVSEGQVQGMEETLARDTEEIMKLDPSITEEALRSGEVTAEEGSPLAEAIRKYNEDTARLNELAEARKQEVEARKAATRQQLEQSVGQPFWMQEDAGDGRYTETVEEIVYSDGRTGYVVGYDDAGNLTLVFSDGTKGFSSREDITNKLNSGEIVSDTPMGLDAYIESKVAQEDAIAEQARMSEEHALSIEDMIATHPQGTVINLGTEEEKIEVTIIAPPTADGAIVQMPDGTTPLMRWEDIAHAERTEITPKTDAQINQSVVDQYKVAYKPAVEVQPEPDATVREQAVERETPAKPLPLKADGTVDQTALWNQNPERWSEWNDEQRQDGGVNSLGYIRSAIAREEAKVSELATAYNSEPDFDTRSGMEQEIQAANERLNRLVSLQQKYAPLMQAEAQQVAEGSEQAEPVVANKDRERSVESVVAALYDKGLDDAEVSANIDANIEEYEKKLAAQSKRAPKMGSDADAYLQKKQKYQEKIDEIQQELNFWASVRQAISGLRENEMQVPEAPGAVGMEKDPEPQNAVEFAARELGLKEGGIKLQRKSFAEHTCYGNEEMKKFFGLFKSKQDGGMTVEQAGERLMEIDRENNTGFFDQDDPNAGLNAILDALSANKTIGELRSYTARRRQQEAQQEADAAYSAMMADYEAAHGMSVEEVADYNAVMRSELIQKGLNETEYNELNSIFAEEISEYDTRTEETFGRSDGEVPSDVEGGSDAVPEGSSNVLQSQQSDYTSGEGTAPEGEQSSEDVGDLYAQDGTSQVQPAAVESSLDEDMPDFLGMSDEDVVRRATEELTTEQERANLEEEKRAALRDRIKEWEQKLGVQVDLMESVDDVTNARAKQQILNGREVFGWFDVTSGKVAFYLPDYVAMPTASGLSEIDKTYIHEVVSHKGLRGLLGEEKYGELCNMVWDAMTEEQKTKFLNYPGVNGNTRAAADEFIAHFAENVDYNDNRTLWDKIVDFIKGLFNSVELPVHISNESLADLLRMSYSRLAKNAAAVDTDSNQQAEGNSMFRAEDGSLVGMHNISEGKLRKAIKQGGLANPSTAVVNIAEYSLEEYGDISLIMPSSLVDSETGDNIGTYTGDAWTPTYPTISRQIDDAGWKVVKDRIRAAVGKSDDLYREIVNSVDNYLSDDRNSRLEFVFLKEKGIDPKIELKGADGFVGMRNLEAILGVEGLRDGMESYEKYKAASPMAKRSFNTWQRVDGDKKAHKVLKDELRQNPEFAKLMGLGDDLTFAQFDSFTYDIFRKEYDAGNINTTDTLGGASRYVDANDMRTEFDTWLESLMQEAGAKEVFFAGWTRDGDRIYKDNTLENVSRHMRMQGRTNAYDDHGLSATKSALLQRLTSLADIRKNRARLQDEASYNKAYDELKERLYSVISQLADMEKISDNPFMNIDYAEARLQEAIVKRNPIAYLNSEYGYNIDAKGEYAEELKSFIRNVQKMPAKYFETKFERPVYLNEFAAVVMPTTTSEDIRQAVSEAGLPIFEYNPTVEGSRKEATMKATEGEGIRFRTRITPENEDIRFRVRGENESAEEFYESALNNYKAKYTVFGDTELFPINQETADRFGYTLEELEKTGGVFVEDDDLIAIFVHEDAVNDLVIENAIFHEDVHWISAFYPYMYNLGEWLWNNAETSKAFADTKADIETDYEESEYHKEMLAYVVSNVMSGGMTSELEALVPSEYHGIIRQIENEIGYDRRSEESSRETKQVSRISDRPTSQETQEDSQDDEESTKAADLRFRTTEITPEVRDEMDVIAATALVNGNYMKAPNGADTNLTAEQWAMVRTKNFLRWFGDWINDPENASKVVDENGEPKVVYHGTGYEGNIFTSGFFASDEQFALDYGFAGNGFNSRLVEAFLNIRNPRVVDAEYSNYDEISIAGQTTDADTLVRETRKDSKYDGLIIKNVDERSTDGDNWTDDFIPFSPSQIKSATDNTGEFSEGESDIRYRVVTDPAKIEELENGPKIKVYRAMQMIDGKLYPPMSAKVDGELREPIELGQWEEAEERPDLADNKGYFKLDKGNKKSLKARYNPYFHTSYTPLNDQFSEAQDRPNLVIAEVEIPVSELTSGYKADKAKDSVGEKEWKAGVIQGKLSGTRKVILSRWDKPVRIVPDSEVADVIVKMFEGKDIVMPSNVVTPSLRAELEKRGVPFVETDNQGKKLTNIAEMTTPIWSSKGTFANLAEAEEWAHKNLQGKFRVNRYTGERISIGSNSISKMLSPKAQKQSSSISAHLAALKSVLDFIKTGIPAEVHADQEGRDFNVLRLYNAIEIDNKLYRVKSTVRKVRQGDKFYTYEVQEMELIEERWSSQKGEADNPRNPDSPINSITGAKLLKGVKKSNSNENILPESENVSFRVNENPTEAQKEAGNYKMGHLNLDGYRITIENPKGSVRRGTDSKGNAWENTLNNDYGYIRGTEGVDGDHIDVYLSDNPSEGNVFVIDQVNPDIREFDEHKVMYGFNSAEEAREAYLANFSEGWNGLGTITEVSKDEFKKWIQSSHRKTKPFSEYKSVNAISSQSEGMEDEVMLRVNGTPTDEVVASGLSLSPAQTADLAGNIFAALPEESRKKITDGLNGNILNLQDAILQIPTSLAIKENWNDEDKAVAEVIAEQMTKAVGMEMTRPFSASEALWTLYNATHKDNDIISEASRALVRSNLGFDSQTLGIIDKAKDGVRFRTVGDASANAEASLYNRGAANVWTRLKESYVDMNASVEKLMKSIEKASGKVAQGFENILMALNQQSSKGLAAMESYTEKFLNPMFDEIVKIMKKAGKSYQDVVRYVILKHGLERNIKLAQRDAKAHYQEIYDDIISKITGMNDAQKRTYLTNAQLKEADAKAELARLQAVDQSTLTDDQLRELKRDLAKARKAVTEAEENLKRAEKIRNMSEQEAQDELGKIFEQIESGKDSVYKELRNKDYSGISSMFYDQLGVDRRKYSTEEEYQAALMQAKQDRFSTLADVEAEAKKEVSEFENVAETKALWKRINAATKETLRQQYEANMISKDQYESLKNMFDFYVPLRGFKDNTAEDMYTYYRKPNSTGYTKPILGAEGRKTEAESPFGWIASMAGSAIASNVKNEAKLALYYFVSNRPDNGIATISKTWFEFSHTDPDTGKKVYKPIYPPFTEDLSSETAKAAYEQWQKDMEAKRAAGLVYESGQRLNLGNAVVNIDSKNQPEHIVTVKVGGKDYTIVINGNPRAAQAINGDLNIETNDTYNNVLLGPWLRWLSSVNTSYNPEFWVTNMMRDVAFTLMSVNIKGDPVYRRKFFKNYAKAFKVISMVAKNEKGTLGNSYIERMYKDFVKYGGVTGFTQIKDSETWEKEIKKYLKGKDVDTAKAIKAVKDGLHAMHRFGESLEQVSRFAAYLTAIETGKSINEAINDAKEITVNFNRKGSGKRITIEEAKKLTRNNGQSLNEVEAAIVSGISYLAPISRSTIMFFNASVQALNAWFKLWKANKLRSLNWVIGYAAIGFMNALIHALLDDDDEYLDIPQYERRSSLMLGGNGVYFKWALPQEMSAFYALGELTVETILGRNPHQSAAAEATKVIGDMLPINIAKVILDKGGWVEAMPSQIKPALELLRNEDYKGDVIFNEQKWLSEGERERTANWESAYKGTGRPYIEISKLLNNLTDNKDLDEAGWINIHPESLEHVVESMTGGVGRTVSKLLNFITASINPEEDVTIKQTPFLNRFLTINDERYKNVHVNDVYDYYAAEAEHVKTLQKKYAKDKDKESLDRLRQSDEFRWMQIYSKYEKAIEGMQERIRAAEGTSERMELMKEQDEIKRQMIKEISQLP